MNKRFCLSLNLKDDPDLISQYIEWHKPDKIWPEITNGLKEIGIIDIEIYLHDTRLMMIIEAPEDFIWDEKMTLLSELPRQKEWETMMGKFQDTSVNSDAQEKWKPMKCIFKLG